MAEQIQNSTISPSATLAADLTAPASTASVVSAANLPASGTFSLLLKGTAEDGSDDGIIAVGAIAGTALSSITWVRNGQGTFPSGTEIEYDLDARALIAYVSEQIAAHEADTTSVHGITDSAKQVPVKIFQPGLRTVVQAATTANITLSGTQTIDGYALSVGEACLVKDQTTASENGVYTVAAGAWTRHADADTADEIYSGIVLVFNGTVNGNKMFVSTNLTPPAIGADAITYAEMNSALSGVDTTPANRFALDLLSFIEGNQNIQGVWTMNEISVQTLAAGVAAIAAVDDGTVGVFFSGIVDVDGVSGIAVLDDASGQALYLSGTGKIATDGDGDLELKSGFGATTNQGRIYINGGQRHKVVTKTSNYTVDTGDHTVAYTTLAAARTVTLPALSAVADGQEFEILDATTGTHADTNNLTIQRAGTDLFVGGGTTTVINTANGYRRIKKVNSRWVVVGSG